MEDTPNSRLSRSDALSILDFCNEAIKIQTEEQLTKLVLYMKRLFPFEFAFCYYVNKNAFTTLEPNLTLDIKNINYPDGILQEYLEEGMYRKDPVVEEYAGSIQVQNWQECFAKHKGTGIIEPLADNDIIDGFTHGTIWPSGGCAFSFACGQSDDVKRTKEVLSYTIPHLGEALKRVREESNYMAQQYSSLLTKREREVLNWLQQGKSSWDISAILKISERTVNFHINNILEKLDASNRTHAVAIAFSYGLIKGF